MRIWDIEPHELCGRHLLGEHAELHGLWSILTQGKKGYSSHPETRRWRGKTKALYLRHQKLVEEMGRRGYRHNSPLDIKQADGLEKQTEFVNSIPEQVDILSKKGCGCGARKESGVV
jgi:Pyrimidine dimer DNA glycosylase